MKKGFTIPELLVAIAMFSLIVGAATNLLVSSIGAQRRSLIGQDMTSQSSFVMEYMTRALRQAQKELFPPACLGNRGDNYELTETGIRFINAQGLCQEFYLEEGRIKEVLDHEDPQNLSSDDFIVSQLSFQISGESQEDALQPRVTLVLAVEHDSAPQFGLQLQTTISQRNIDILK